MLGLRRLQVPWIDFSCFFSDGMILYVCVYIYIPGTQLTSIFEGQLPKTRPFRIKTRVIWVLGICNRYITWYFLGVEISTPNPRLIDFWNRVEISTPEWNLPFETF